MNWTIGHIYKDRGGRTYTLKSQSSNGTLHFDRRDDEYGVIPVKRNADGTVLGLAGSPCEFTVLNDSGISDRSTETDQELADEFRRVRNELRELNDVLVERGHSLGWLLRSVSSIIL